MPTDSLSRANTLHTLLKTHFGYDHFRPLQEEIITHITAQKDAFVLMPTGGGKSLCYQLPALYFEGITLVVSPLIALMKDQVDALTANGIPAAFLNSSLTVGEMKRVQEKALQGELKLLYIAPERLAVPDFQSFLQSLPVSLVAIDEAHCISEWGHDFRPDYRNLRRLREQFTAVPVVALTATATHRVREDIIEQLGFQNSPTFISSFNRDNLSYHVRPKRNSFMGLVDILKKHPQESAIVYCFSRSDTESMAANLREAGFTALPYHAGLSSETRKANQDKFIRDEVQIMVATIAFGMGIDKPDIRLIVHMDLPKTLEGYYQETGRAGRDGLPSECILFYSYGDKMKQDFFINQLEDPLERTNAQQKLTHVIDFCQLETCRRAYLLHYFGEMWEKQSCDACDACLTPREQFDATEITKKILSAVVRTGERFGLKYVTDVLIGAKDKKIRERGHDMLSVFGIARDMPESDVMQIMASLVTRQFLMKNEGEYATFRLSQRAKQFLLENESIMLAKPLVREISLSRRKKTKGELEYNQDLFEVLRVLRKELADARGVPPFVIFGDATLQEMATYYPRDNQSLREITGVGDTKLKQFGPTFLPVISDFVTQHDIPDARPISTLRLVRRGAEEKEGLTSTYLETKRLLDERFSVEMIAKARNLTEQTVLSHVEKLLLEGTDVITDHLKFEVEDYKRTAIEKAFLQSGTESLSQVKAALGDAYTYTDIRITRILLRHHL
ncbi:MAG TPA: DNA helicase RecQ [Patescibacteria group bacterium]